MCNSAASAAGDEIRTLEALLHLATQVTRVSSSIFYWLDEDLRMQPAVLNGIDLDCLGLYRSTFHDHDPCSPVRMAGRGARTQRLRAVCADWHGSDIEPYRPYMALSRIQDVIELLFWQSGRAVAGMGLIARKDDPVITTDAVALAGSTQRYVEASLFFHPRLLRQRVRNRLLLDRRLSQRELTVADLISRGLTNQEIGEELEIALPTVKSHVRNVFEKLAVGSRTAMMAEMRRIEAETA
jgi:DNA-binding CsgD family transcriptional regulator